ncbi:MAG: hypothetical protein NW207_07045 [Cytophagales bacterium]|nr:hypothetical protein [Cytophagales bacterium]
MKTLIKSSALVILGITLSLYTYAQSEVFKVLASRGKNTLSDGTAIVAGKKLSNSDVVTVGANSYLGLIHNSGKSVEVKEAGTYKIAELASKALAKNSSVTKKYSDYVLGELTKSDGADIHAQYQKNMKVTGSVERAISSASIALCLPKSSSIIETVNTISWVKNPKATSYTVEILNMFDDVILSKETSDTSFTFDINSIKMPKDNTLMVRVKANSELKSDNFVLKTMNISKNPDVVADNDFLKKEYSEESALNYLMKASFYAQNNLFIDAKKSFEAAIRLEPEIVEYRNAYKNFLAKNNMIEYYPYSK